MDRVLLACGIQHSDICELVVGPDCEGPYLLDLGFDINVPAMREDVFEIWDCTLQHK